MADLLAAYTERQICALQKEKAHPQNWVDKTEGKLPGKDVLEEIPRVRQPLINELLYSPCGLCL